VVAQAERAIGKQKNNKIMIVLSVAKDEKSVDIIYAEGFLVISCRKVEYDRFS
jgi:hypothetical protein